MLRMICLRLVSVVRVFLDAPSSCRRTAQLRKLLSELPAENSYVVEWLVTNNIVTEVTTLSQRFGRSCTWARMGRVARFNPPQGSCCCSTHTQGSCCCYKSFNSLYSKCFKLSEPVLLHLINVHCKPFLLYGMEAVNLSNRELNTLNQRSQTRGPRAACGPRGHFVRPATHFGIFNKLTIIIHFFLFISPPFEL